MPETESLNNTSVESGVDIMFFGGMVSFGGGSVSALIVKAM
jgi:hypothetical protein